MWASSEGSLGLKLDQSLVGHFYKFCITFTPAQIAQRLAVLTYSSIDTHVCAHLSVCAHVHEVPKEARKRVSSLGIRVTRACELPYRCREPTWSSARTVGAGSPLQAPLLISMASRTMLLLFLIQSLTSQLSFPTVLLADANSLDLSTRSKPHTAPCK